MHFLASFAGFVALPLLLLPLAAFSLATAFAFSAFSFRGFFFRVLLVQFLFWQMVTSSGLSSSALAGASTLGAALTTTFGAFSFVAAFGLARFLLSFWFRCICYQAMMSALTFVKCSPRFSGATLCADCENLAVYSSGVP